MLLTKEKKLIDFREYGPLKEAQARLANMDENISKFESVAQAASEREQGLEKELDNQEALQTIGKENESIESLRAKYEKAKRTTAEARKALEKNRKARAYLVEGIKELTEDARILAAKGLISANKETVARLAKAVEGAATENAELKRLIDLWNEQFAYPQKPPKGTPSSPSGNSLDCMAWDELDLNDPNSKVNRWKKELIQYGYDD